MSEITRILTAIDRGDEQAADVLLPLVYRELRNLAARKMAQEAPGQTLQATALVHEAYLRLADQESMDWRDRAHFYAIAARVMRRVLIDHARRRLADKRGGGQAMVTLHEDAAAVTTPENLLELDRALVEYRRAVELTAHPLRGGYLLGDMGLIRATQKRATNGTLVVCDRAARASPVALVVSYTGRPRAAEKDPRGRPYSCAD